MSQPTTNLSVSDLRKEYLAWFVDWRKEWEKMRATQDETGEVYCYEKMKFFGSLIDLTTRLQNEMKGRSR